MQGLGWRGGIARRGGPGARSILALAQCFFLVASTSCVPLGASPPQPGVLEYARPLFLELPQGRVNVAGGNLVLRRRDFSLDTFFGTLEVGAVYNSATRQWAWPFAMSYDGEIFVDETGAVHDLGTLAPGAAVPGTHWVKLDDQRVKTKGGYVYHFGIFHQLVAMTGTHGMRPALIYAWEFVDGRLGATGVSQCRAGYPCRPVYDIEYDDRGCVSGLEDRAGRRAEFENDPACRPEVARDALDGARGWPGGRYAYSQGLLESYTNSEGERVEFEYASGRLASARRMGAGEGATSFRYGYDPQVELFFTLVEDVRGGRSVYRYDADHRLHTARDAAGGETTLSWSGRRPLSRLAPDGTRTRWVFQDDDPVEVESSSGNIIAYAYAPEAQNWRRPLQRPLAQVSDSLGMVEARSYDARGYPLSVTNGEGETRWHYHDEEGLLSILREASGVETGFYDYGEHGHATRFVQGASEYHRRYDSVGNLLEGPGSDEVLSPGRPGIRRRVFDEDRNVVLVELAGKSTLDASMEESAELALHYRSDGRVAMIERPYGGDAVFDYDGAGRLASRRERVDGAWQSQTYEYADSGDLAAIELANGMRTELLRDVMGRPIRFDYLDAGGLEQRVDLGWEAGRLDFLIDSRRPGMEVYGYDAAGRPAFVGFPEGEVLRREYDARSREIQRQFHSHIHSPAWRTLGFAYDRADRRVGVTDQGEEVLGRHFDEGRLVEETYGNGLHREYLYDSGTGRLARTVLWEADWNRVARTELSWSDCEIASTCLSATTEIEGAASGGLGGLYSEEVYTLAPRPGLLGSPEGYGPRLRAWEATGPGSESFGMMGEYAFDALGNWLGVATETAPKIQFEYNAERNRLLASLGADAHDYVWDESGFLLRRDETDFRWNAAGLLEGIGDSIQLQWDSLGRPLSVSTPDGTRRMLFGGSMVGDAARQPLSLEVEGVQIRFATGERVYQHKDFRGNVQMVSDGEGQLVEFYGYGPFGLASAYGDSVGGRNFAGGRSLGEFLILGRRVYDPQAGRFISPDSRYNPLNQFAYTLGNPVSFWDPGGEAAELSPLSESGEVASQAARAILELGAEAFGAGLDLGSVPLLVLGLSFMVFATVAALAVIYCFNESAGGVVSIIDLSSGSGDAVAGSGGVAAGSEIVACSPLTLAGPGEGGWPMALIVPGQFALAALLLGWHRKRRGRRCEPGLG
jgi:RHS repeat-associated protein